MTKKISLALALIASSVSYAQQAAPQATVTQESASLLGSRYAQAAFGFADINHSSTDVFATGVAVNLPVAKGFDVTTSFAHTWQEGDASFNAQSLSVGGTYFVAEGDTKPFISADLGYQWRPSGVKDVFVWGSDVGVEYSVNTKMAATVSVGYSGDFESHVNGSWGASVGGQYVVAKNTLVGLAVNYAEGGDWVYTVTAAYKF